MEELSHPLVQLRLRGDLVAAGHFHDLQSAGPIVVGAHGCDRGVDVESVLGTLLRRGYIQEVGRDPGPGQAVLYGTTREFLERFGLNDITDLPKVEELSDALGFDLPPGLAEPTITTSPLPFDSSDAVEEQPQPEPTEDETTVH